MEIQFNIEPTEGQKLAWDLVHNDKNKIVVLCWSRQSGKSILAELLLIEYLFKNNLYSAYISPTFQLGRKIYKEITSMLQPTGIIKKANSSTLTIETIYNSTLQCFSAEAYTSIRGVTVSGVLIIDEAAYIADIMPNGENFWGNIVMPITKARKPKVVLISTPRMRQGFFHDFYLRALNNEDGIVQLTRTIHEDSLVTETEIEEIKRNIPPKAFEQEFECKFLDSSLTFFQGFENVFEDFHYAAGKEWCGIDLSSTQNGDDTVVTFVNNRNEFDVIKISGTLQEKYIKIANLINQRSPIAIYMESNGVGLPMIEQVKKLVKNSNRIHEWVTSNSSKEEIISQLAVEIANKNVHFQKNDTELYSQFSTFICTISKTKKLTFAAQAGKKDDMVMAAAMALRCKNDFKYAGGNNNSFIAMPNKRLL